MKYLMLVGDGMADIPVESLGGKTPLEHSKTPAMDSVAAKGRIGMVKTVPDGLPPGSDVANMSLMGYDPVMYYSGRAPIEAASMGIALDKNDTAFRCNLVNIKDGLMSDYSSGHIETDDSTKIIKELRNLDTDKIRFYSGVSYRHLLVIRDFPEGRLECTPPHDISGKQIAGYLPKGSGNELLERLANDAREILSKSLVNKQRIEHDKKPATDIWLWGQGKAKSFPTMQKRFGISGAVISAVDLVRGLGKLAGLSVKIVDGATGYLGTNYKGKIKAAAEALKAGDFAFVHIEAPDETSHEGDLSKKIRAIEEFDSLVVAEGLSMCASDPNLRLIVLPDHPTLISTKTHDASPVPFAVCGSGITPGKILSYCEKNAAGSKVYTGEQMFSEFIKGNFA
jgi:2,3-bisphosphoglycerate-independent phosphoglycerate mutase